MCFYFVQLYTFLKSILCMYIYVFVYLFILLLLEPKLSSTSGMTFVSIHPYLQSWLQTLFLLRMDKIAKRCHSYNLWFIILVWFSVTSSNATSHIRQTVETLQFATNKGSTEHLNTW